MFCQYCGGKMTHVGVKVSELLALVQRDYSINGKRSKYNVDLYINNQLIPALGARVANHVRKSHVEHYKAQRKAKGASEVTINRELAVLKRAFNLGIEDELIERKPTIKLFTEPEPREGHYEHDEFNRFQDIARALGARQNYDGPLVADIVLFGYYSGWRLRECLGLHKDWIRVKDRVVILPASKHKTKRPKVYPLEGKVWEMVERRLAAAAPSGLLFHRRNRPVKSIRRICMTICCTAKINSEHFFHNLRRSCTTNLDRAGVEQSTGMKITGHTTSKVYENYNQHSIERLRLAVRKVEEYLEPREQEEPSKATTEISTQEKQLRDQTKKATEMAERAGFEPANRVSDYLISSQVDAPKPLESEGILVGVGRFIRRFWK